ncbi:MAG: acyl-CoA dehydrogenase family protein [Eggerthellaceae bacterium]
MDFVLSENQKNIIATFRAFGESVFTPDHVFQWRKDQGLPDDVAQGFVERYFALSQAQGGGRRGLGVMAQTLILEELSRCAGAVLPFQNDLFNLQIIGGFADEGVVSSVLDDYRNTGRLMFSLGVSEPNAGSDTMGMKTSVETRDGKIMLNGQKTYVNNGEYSPSILVAAIDRDETVIDDYPPLSFWLIPHDLPGIRAVPINKIGQSMVPFASVSFDEVELKPEYRLKGHEGGFRHLFKLLEYGRVFTCATSVGMAQAAMEDAVENARIRKAFGVSIGQFQQIEQMLTDMEISLRTMRAMLYHAAWAMEADKPDKRLAVALMKRYIPKTATQVASDAMQILGGLGYTESSRVSTIWEDCRGNQIAEGTDQIMVYIAAPLIMDSYAE